MFCDLVGSTSTAKLDAEDWRERDDDGACLDADPRHWLETGTITLTPLDRRQVGAILGQGHVEQRRQQRDIFGRVYPDRLERRLEIGEPPLDAHF